MKGKVNRMDTKAMYKLGYGLYVLSAHEAGKDNACIVNTVIQVTTSPNRITVAVNKQNYTREMIDRTNKFNVSVLAESAPFSLFQRFGFQSGRDTDKFAGFHAGRSGNGLLYVPEHCTALLSCWVVDKMNLGSHTLFLADVADCAVLSDEHSVTYAYYQKHIKPAPAPKAKGWRCRICGYVYEGDELPADFICPICKHGAIDFEKIV